jgi:hypothetical protein
MDFRSRIRQNSVPATSIWRSNAKAVEPLGQAQWRAKLVAGR